MVSVERAVQYIEDIPSEVSPHGTVRDSILEKYFSFWGLLYTRFAQALKKYQVLEKEKLSTFLQRIIQKTILRWVFFLDIKSFSSTKYLFWAPRW